MLNPQLNKVFLMGTVTTEPAVRDTRYPTAEWMMATTSSWYEHSSHQRLQHTEKVTVIVYENIAQYVLKYLHQGYCVWVEGYFNRLPSHHADNTLRIIGETVKIIAYPTSHKREPTPLNGCAEK